MNNTSSEAHESKSGIVVSLAFWMCLFIAAGLFAAVVLSPKILTHVQLQNEFYQNQVRLVEIEKQVGRLEKVADALKGDPEFAAEVLRRDFDAVRPGDERIDVKQASNAGSGSSMPVGPAPANPLSSYEPLLSVLANQAIVRMTLLAVASVLTVLAFTFLQESPRPADSAANRRWWHWLGNRYGRRRPDA